MGTRQIISDLLHLRRHRGAEPTQGRHHAEEMSATTRRTVRSLRAQHGMHSWATTASGQHTADTAVA